LKFFCGDGEQTVVDVLKQTGLKQSHPHEDGKDQERADSKRGMAEGIHGTS
jgi:hypothetical protein